MRTFITQKQLEALQTAFGPEIDPFLSQIGIEASVPDIDSGMRRLNELRLYDVREMSRHLGVHPALCFFAEDIRTFTDGRPWLTEEQADDVAAAAAKWFTYEESEAYIEGALRHFGYPLDPPGGWFEWTSRAGTVQWQQWCTEDDEEANRCGWKVEDPTSVPKILWSKASDNDEGSPDVQAWVRAEAAEWRSGNNNFGGRVATRAIALLAQAAERQRTEEDNNPFHNESPGGRAWEAGDTP